MARLDRKLKKVTEESPSTYDEIALKVVRNYEYRKLIDAIEESGGYQAITDLSLTIEGKLNEDD